MERRIQKYEISKQHFQHFVSLPGIWTQRLYHLFDYKDTRSLDFVEFLNGIGNLKS